ncbi:MAG TPA: acyl-CoA dehydrogenase family protein, partial [Thermoanaerobaculia bacterium]|nr:acyl-CoA dehydrogenase family protein [Thermoanaerobaculia bacterium]
LKLALITLNTGRLTIPAGCAAGARRALQITRDWANERVQWGMPIGYHEAIADKIARMTANTFAAESIVWLTSGLADRGDVDLRIEAAMAKLFNTEVTWDLIDDLVQIRGGRGYETEKSLRERGEKPWPVERMLRDSRINRIFEGTSEIQHLFIAREAVDPHMEYAQFMMQKDPSFGELAKGAAKAGAHYATWYPKLFVPKRQGDYSQLGSLSGQMKWVEKTSRRLARGIFHAMSRYQQKLEKKQRILFRIVDIGVDLFAMSATVTYATHLSKNKGRHNAIDLAEAFCNQARVRIDQTFDQLFTSNDAKEYKMVKSFLEGDYEWFEGDMVEFVLSTPEKVEEAIAEMAQ